MSNTNEAIEQLRPTLQSAGYDIIGNNIVRKLDEGQVRAAELMARGSGHPGYRRLLDDVCAARMSDEIAGDAMGGDRFE